MTKAIAASMFALAGAASSMIFLSFFGSLLGATAVRMGVYIAPFAGLSAFIAYFIVARKIWMRIVIWQLRAILFGIAVVFIAHLLLGVPVYFLMAEEDRELSIGFWMFAGTSFVTLPLGIATAFVLEARQRSVKSR